MNEFYEMLGLTESATDEEIQAVEAAVADVEKQLDETIVDNAGWKAAVEDLRVALADAGVIEDTAPTELENTLTLITKYLSKGVNFIYDMI